MGGAFPGSSLGSLASLLFPESVPVTWAKYTSGAWCGLATLNLAAPELVDAGGVYVIWRPYDRRAVRVGQGTIVDRLRQHRCDREILTHGPGLLVTWANVAPSWRDGVERYLANQYQPLVGTTFPFATPIPVNLP